jgi:hypothetical protein
LQILDGFRGRLAEDQWRGDLCHPTLPALARG